ATPGYFDAIGMTLLGGRTFDGHDGRGSLPVVIVNQSFSRHFWGDQSPVGKRIRYPGGRDWYQVVGWLRDEKHDGLDQPAAPTVYLPYPLALTKADPNDLRSLRLMTVVLRGPSEPGVMVGPAREAVRQLDPGVPVYAVQTMIERLDRSLWARRAYS